MTRLWKNQSFMLSQAEGPRVAGAGQIGIIGADGAPTPDAGVPA